MAALTIRELPPKTLSSLKSRASLNHRSLNGEILSILDYVVSFGIRFEFTATPPADPSVEKQKQAILALAGTWEDDRSDEEIIADIESSRTLGREVSL